MNETRTEVERHRRRERERERERESGRKKEIWDKKIAIGTLRTKMEKSICLNF
jgi:hypothetical protein